MTTHRRDQLHPSPSTVATSLLQRSNRRRRNRSTTTRRFQSTFHGLESLERRDLFAGDAFAAVDDAASNAAADVVLIAPEHLPIAAEAPLGEDRVELPPTLEQLRLDLGDEGFAHWLESNQEQFGSLQGFDAQQVGDLEANDPEAFEQYSTTEALLENWLDVFHGNENCDGPTEVELELIENAFLLRPDFNQILVESGDEQLVFVLQTNHQQSGNFQNVDVGVVENWEVNFPELFIEFETIESGLQLWLETVDLGEGCEVDGMNKGPAPDLPPALEQLRQELGEESFAEWLASNQEQFGNLQGVNEQIVNDLRENAPSAYEEFETAEQTLQAWLDWHQCVEPFQITDIFIGGTDWLVSDFVLPTFDLSPPLDLTLPWVGMDYISVGYIGEPPLLHDLHLSHELIPSSIDTSVPGIATWMLPVQAGLGTIGGFSPGGVDDFVISIGDKTTQFDVVPGDIDGIGHLTDIGDILTLFDPLHPNGIGFATTIPVRTDIDGSGLVDIGDLLLVVDHLGAATIPLPPQPIAPAAAPLPVAALPVDAAFAEVESDPMVSNPQERQRPIGTGRKLARFSPAIESTNELEAVDDVFSVENDFHLRAL